MRIYTEQGFAPVVLLLIAGVGLLSFFIASSSLPLGASMISSLFPKPNSYASVSGPVTPSPCVSCPVKAKPGDTDLNGTVDIFDYNNLLTDFNKTGMGIRSDFDFNQKVDIFDYNILLSNFGK